MKNLNAANLNTSLLSTLNVNELTSIYQSEDCPQFLRRAINALDIWNEVEVVSATTVFGKYWAGEADYVVERRVHRHPDVDQPASVYIPDAEMLMDVVMYLMGERVLSLGIFGETGTGKSELPRYVSHMLNIPMLQVSLTASSREDKLQGTYQLKDGNTFFLNGVVPTAYDHRGPGYMLVVNELDKGNESVIAKLHDITDSKPFTVDDTGEVFFPHPKFRFIGTSQTPGQGCDQARYNVQKLDRAFCARFMWSEAKYPSREIMIDILTNDFAELQPSLIKRMAGFFHLTTVALNNGKLEDEGGEMATILNGNSAYQRIDTPISIRLMRGWANAISQFGASRTVYDSFKQTIKLSAEKHDCYALDMLLESCLGDLMNAKPQINKVAMQNKIAKRKERYEAEMTKLSSKVDISPLLSKLFFNNSHEQVVANSASSPVAVIPSVKVVDEQAEADAKAQAEAQAKAKAEADAKAQAEAQAKAKAEADAKAQAEAQAKAQAEAEAAELAQREADLVAAAEFAERFAEEEAKAKAEAEALAQAEADALAEAEALAQAEAEANKDQVSYPSSELQNISNVLLWAYCHTENEKRKIWSVGADSRGCHIVYSHPEDTNSLIYYFKPMTDFASIEDCKAYISNKIVKKMESGYVKSMDVHFDHEKGTFYL